MLRKTLAKIGNKRPEAKLTTAAGIRAELKKYHGHIDYKGAENDNSQFGGNKHLARQHNHKSVAHEKLHSLGGISQVDLGAVGCCVKLPFCCGQFAGFWGYGDKRDFTYQDGLCAPFWDLQ
jgi:hypothetical protein